eukprot:372297_1
MALIDSAGQVNQDIMAGTMLAVGLFVTFFGARFFKYIVFFVGFIIGGFLTYYSLPIIMGWFQSDVEDDTLLYICLTVGALCGVLLVVVYKAAVFSCGAICGAIFSQILWIAIVANIDTEGKDWLEGAQIGVLVVFALIGGFLAFKFVEQVLKAVTAFVGGFMFASATAFFIARIEISTESRNVIDWVVFFGSYQNYVNFEDVCDTYCIVCMVLWLVLFASGCFVQYKLHKKHKRKDHDDQYESDSEYSGSDDSRARHHKSRKHGDSDYSSSDESSDTESSRTSRKSKRKKRREVDNDSYGNYNQYDEQMQVGSYHGPRYGNQSLRMGAPAQNYARSEGFGARPSQPGGAPPRQAMSSYGPGTGNAQPRGPAVQYN